MAEVRRRGQDRRRGGQPGNKNALKHGHNSRGLKRDENDHQAAVIVNGGCVEAEVRISSETGMQ